MFSYHLSDWTAVDEYEVEIAYDLESSPLQIVTDSMLGSEELIRVDFKPEEENMGHGVLVQFTDPPQYKIVRDGDVIYQRVYYGVYRENYHGE